MAISRILWIEDGANFELAELLAPVYYLGQHVLDIAESASEAVDLLSGTSLHEPYDALIVDIRLSPGGHRLWQDLYKKTVRGAVETQLGLLLLYWLLGKAPCTETAQHTMAEPLARLRKAYPPPSGFTPAQLAVFTIERPAQLEHGGHLQCLSLQHYFQKKLSSPDDILLRIVRQITRPSSGGK